VKEIYDNIHDFTNMHTNVTETKRSQRAFSQERAENRT